VAFCRKGNYLMSRKKKTLGDAIIQGILQGTIEGIFGRPKRRKKR
jgi:hypothetical protein